MLNLGNLKTDSYVGFEDLSYPEHLLWSEFRLFPENQSKFGLNLLRKPDFFNFRSPMGPGMGSTDGLLGAPVKGTCT